MIVITVDNELDLKKVIYEKGIVVNSLTLSSMITTLKISSVSLTFKTDGRWDWSSVDRNNERTINDIKGRLDLDHLSNDELVEHLCETHDEKIELLARDLLMSSLSHTPVVDQNYQIKVTLAWKAAREFYKVKL